MAEKNDAKRISLKELNEHTGSESLWLLIDDCIYDVTKFMDEHPGGREVLEDEAGKDATMAFNEVGHSEDAKSMMKDYKIGELSEVERKKIKKSSFPSSCVWYRMLVPVGVLLAASFIAYRYYARRN